MNLSFRPYFHSCSISCVHNCDYRSFFSLHTDYNWIYCETVLCRLSGIWACTQHCEKHWEKGFFKNLFLGGVWNEITYILLIACLVLHVPAQYIGFLLDKSGEGTHSLYITEAHEGMINFIDAIPKVINFGELPVSCWGYNIIC